MGTSTRPDCKKIKINTNVWPIIDCGTYGTELDIDSACQIDMILEDMHESQTKGTCDIYDCGACIPYSYIGDYNYERYEEILIKCAIPYISDAIKSINVLLGKKFIEERIGKSEVTFVSPREYNFLNDRMDIEITIFNYKTLVKKLLKFFSSEIFDDEYKYDNISVYISENWKSRSGFMSFMPQSILEMAQSLQNILDGEEYDEDRVIGGALCLLYLCTEDPFCNQQSFVDDVYEKVSNENLIEIKNEFPEFFEGFSCDKINEILFDAYYSTIGHAWVRQQSKNVSLENDYDKFVNWVWSKYDSLEELMEDINKTE